MQTIRWTTGTTAALLAAGLVRSLALAQELGVTSGSGRWMALFAMWGIALFAAAALFGLTLTPAGRRLADGLVRLRTRLRFPAPLAVAVCAVFALALPAAVLTPLPEPLETLVGTLAWRLAILWFACLLGAAALSLGVRSHTFPALLLGTALAYGVVHQAAVFIPEISTNPFSLAWSEASRFYYASLFVSERVYGVRLPWSVLHPTRYWLQAAPFFVDGLPIWLHRLWQVFLWLGANGLAAWLLARRPGLSVETGGKRLLLAAWAFLFLFQGPIWYHLVVMAGFVYWGADSRNSRRTLIVVAVASLWAGVSRVNWIPFPAALAALIYFIEVPQGERPLLHYLSPILIWGLAGAAAGFGAQAAYVAISGNPSEQFGSAFTSGLLWYRLFPNATYPPGVLPGILLASLPAAAAIGWAVRAGKIRIERLRWLGLAAILGVFFAGGLVVSAKIGGGSNLHNMDAYLALLAAAAVLIVFGKAAGPVHLPWLVLALAVAVPVGFAAAGGGPVRAEDPAVVREELAELERLVEGAAARGGEVLFISERHLLTFRELEGVGLEPDFEKVFLMEMAMAGNAAYLGRFEADLAAGRYALIVSDIVNLNFQGREDDFGEENNAWDRYVTFPLLCFYEEIQTLDQAGVEILAPKASPGCPEIPLE